MAVLSFTRYTKAIAPTSGGSTPKPAQPDASPLTAQALPQIGDDLSAAHQTAMCIFRLLDDSIN
jgi:hypothetical protein